MIIYNEILLGHEPIGSMHAIFEGSLEVKLPTIWTVEKQR